MTATVDRWETAPALHADHDPAIEVRAGRDLIVTVCAAAGPRPEPGSRWHVLAYDGDGNYLSTLATVHGIGWPPDPVLTAAIDTARGLYPEHLGGAF